MKKFVRFTFNVRVLTHSFFHLLSHLPSNEVLFVGMIVFSVVFVLVAGFFRMRFFPPRNEHTIDGEQPVEKSRFQAIFRFSLTPTYVYAGFMLLVAFLLIGFLLPDPSTDIFALAPSLVLILPAIYLIWRATSSTRRLFFDAQHVYLGKEEGSARPETDYGAMYYNMGVSLFYTFRVRRTPEMIVFRRRLVWPIYFYYVIDALFPASNANRQVMTFGMSQVVRETGGLMKPERADDSLGFLQDDLLQVILERCERNKITVYRKEVYSLVYAFALVFALFVGVLLLYPGLGARVKNIFPAHLRLASRDSTYLVARQTYGDDGDGQPAYELLQVCDRELVNGMCIGRNRLLLGGSEAPQTQSMGGLLRGYFSDGRVTLLDVLSKDAATTPVLGPIKLSSNFLIFHYGSGSNTQYVYDTLYRELNAFPRLPNLLPKQLIRQYEPDGLILIGPMDCRSSLNHCVSQPSFYDPRTDRYYAADIARSHLTQENLEVTRVYQERITDPKLQQDTWSFGRWKDDDRYEIETRHLDTLPRSDGGGSWYQVTEQRADVVFHP